MNIASKIHCADIIKDTDHALIIFNPSDVARTGVVEAEVITETQTQKEADWQLDPDKNNLNSKDKGVFALKDDQGKSIPYQTLNKKEVTDEIAFWADEIPPFGYRTYGVDFSEKQALAETANIADEKKNVLENDIVKVRIHESGALTILDKRNGAVFKDQNILEDSADRGDTYNYDPLDGEALITTKGVKGKITVKQNGPFSATCEVKTKLILPEGLTPDRKARNGKLITLPVFFYITLKKDSPLVYITAKIDNQVKDHRLRAVFRGPKCDVVHVQTQGDVVKRRLEEFKVYPQSWKRDIAHHTSIGALPKETGPSPTQFQRNFVGINDNKKGLVILNKGLPEYEATPDGTIALTLLRSVGWLSQDDLRSRERLAGPKISVPDAQCRREHIFEYAIVTQSGSWNAASLYREENQYSIPLKNMIIHRQEGILPSKLSFLRIKPDELMVSAIKKAYNDNDLIVRLFNPTGKLLKGRVGILHGIKQAWLADLNEEKKKKIPVGKDGMAFVEVGPKKIVTVRLKKGNHYHPNNG